MITFTLDLTTWMCFFYASPLYIISIPALIVIGSAGLSLLFWKRNAWLFLVLIFTFQLMYQSLIRSMCSWSLPEMTPTRCRNLLPVALSSTYRPHLSKMWLGSRERTLSTGAVQRGYNSVFQSSRLRPLFADSDTTECSFF